jgi:hypothetical protein
MSIAFPKKAERMSLLHQSSLLKRKMKRDTDTKNFCIHTKLDEDGKAEVTVSSKDGDMKMNKGDLEQQSKHYPQRGMTMTVKRGRKPNIAFFSVLFCRQNTDKI